GCAVGQQRGAPSARALHGRRARRRTRAPPARGRAPRLLHLQFGEDRRHREAAGRGLSGAMTAFIGLLRAINLPSHNKVGMVDLRALLAKLGFEEPRSMLQSGNLVFAGEGRTSAQLESLLEVEAKKRLGLATDSFVRSARE